MIPEGGAEVEGAKPVHTLAAIALKQVKLTCPTIRYADSNMQEWSVGAPQSDGRILKIARTPQPDSRRPAGLRIGEAGETTSPLSPRSKVRPRLVPRKKDGTSSSGQRGRYGGTFRAMVRNSPSVNGSLRNAAHPACGTKLPPVGASEP
jgi:hypothetical protein